MSDQVRKRVIEIIAEQAMLEVTDVTPEAAPGDIGLDSLGLVETIFAIEEEFNISIPFNANEPEKSDFDISSVATIADAISALVLANNA